MPRRSTALQLEGMRFGKLIAVRRVGTVIHSGRGIHAQWLCKCDCGGEKLVTAGALRDKRGTKSCGCLRGGRRYQKYATKEDALEAKRNQIREWCRERREKANIMAASLEGQRFGKLMVISRNGSKRDKWSGCVATWLCKCDCGGERIVSTKRLNSGHTTSCGCKRRGPQKHKYATDEEARLAECQRKREYRERIRVGFGPKNGPATKVKIEDLPPIPSARPWGEPAYGRSAWEQMTPEQKKQFL